LNTDNDSTSARTTVKAAAKKPATKRSAASKAKAPAKGRVPATGRAPAKGRAPTKGKAPARKSAGTSKKPAARKSAPKKAPVTKVAAADKPLRSKSDKSAAPFTGETGRLRTLVVGALAELKAKDVKEIDIRGRASFADLLVIASGTSTRHVKSLADEVVKFVKKAGMMPLGVEGEREAEWVLVDLGDIVVHVMLPRIREFYGLERLWSVGGDLDAADESPV